MEVRKDVFDMAMKKITAQAEIEMLNIELKQIIEEYAQDIDLKESGLEVWSRFSYNDKGKFLNN